VLPVDSKLNEYSQTLIPISLASLLQSIRFVSDEKQSSSHLRELKAKSHNFTMVSNISPSSGGWKAGFGVVASVVASWMVVAGRVVGVSGFISCEFEAQEVKRRVTANRTKNCFILLNQLTYKVEFC